jgi:hypothetical protein
VVMIPWLVVITVIAILLVNFLFAQKSSHNSSMGVSLALTWLCVLLCRSMCLASKTRIHLQPGATAPGI